MTRYKLGEIVDIKYGKDHKKLNAGRVPVYGTGGIMRYVDNYLYDGESVLIPRKGSLNNIYYVVGKFWTVDTIFWTIINKNIVLPKYLFYFLKRIDFEKLNVGSAVPSLTQKILNEIQIDVPSIEKQKDIIDKISVFERKINLNNKINTNLLELGLELISNINFENYQSLNKIVEVKDGTHSSPASTLNGYPLVTSKAIKGTSVDFSQTKNISEADFTEINKRSLVEYHDILISMIGTVGIVHLVTENPVKYAIKNVGLIKSSDKKLLSPFLYLYLLSYYGQTYIRKHLSGSTQQFISLTNLRKMPIPISSDIPAKLIEKLNTIVLQIEHNSNENNTLNSIKNVLLEKYF